MACSPCGTARARASIARRCFPSRQSRRHVQRRRTGAMGDDHTAEFSTTAHQSEYHFIDVMISVLNPAGVQEVLGLRPVWLGDVALHRHLGGAEDDARDDRVPDGRHRRQPRPHQYHQAVGFPDAGGRPQHPSQRSDPDSRSASARSQARRHARHSCAPTSSIAPSRRAAATPRSASSPRARVISTFARHSTNSASMKSSATNSASGSRSRLRLAIEPPASCRSSPKGLDPMIVVEEALAARSPGPRGALRHAQSTSCASAKRTSRAIGCSRSKARSIPTKSRSASATGF